MNSLPATELGTEFASIAPNQVSVHQCRVNTPCIELALEQWNLPEAGESSDFFRIRMLLFYFDIAWAFCSDVLRRRRDCQYLAFHEAHMGLQGRAFQANIFIVDMVFLGDTRSAEELAVFTNMAPERLCLGCGLRVETIFPGERAPLFTASVKIL